MEKDDALSMTSHLCGTEEWDVGVWTVESPPHIQTTRKNMPMAVFKYLCVCYEL